MLFTDKYRLYNKSEEIDKNLYDFETVGSNYLRASS
jgi:hypothetical protein